MKNFYSPGKMILLLFAFALLAGFTDYNNGIKYPSSKEGKPLSSPELEREFFRIWHYPYGTVVPHDVTKRMWDEINALPSEDELSAAVNSWRFIGPSGMNVTGTSAKYSGRILDIEVDNGVSVRVAAASGGLWGVAGLLFPVCLTDNLSSLAIGSFDSKPGSANEIIIGTGEPYQRSGTGIYRTTNSGVTWADVTPGLYPGDVYKVRYSNSNPNIVHLAATNGYYKSTNSGVSWVRKYSGDVSDVAVSTSDGNTVYIGVWGDGLYRSTNAGENFTKLTTGGVPSSNVGRTSISMHFTQPATIYVSIARNDNNRTLGAYRTINNGTNWTTVTPDPNFLGGQGWYDNMISVCPTNSNIVLAGGISLYRTTNGGTSWTPISDANIHADQHCAAWSNDGGSVWVGNDGGMAYSTDQGGTYSTVNNYWPITQYVNFDIGRNNTNIIFGGSQDNGLSGTTNGGVSWSQTLGGDGGGIAIDPDNASQIYSTNGVYGGSWAFQRLKSTDFGQTWAGINNGIAPDPQWYHKIRNDKASPIYLYNNSGTFVYRSTDFGASWSVLNPNSFPCSYILDINVAVFALGSPVYACLWNETPTADRLRVFNGSTWVERSAGLPADANVRKVGLHQSNSAIGYAVMNGYSDEKIFRTTNRGINWTNITGDFPNVPTADLIPHPTDNNKLYAGTEAGCYRTTNGGINWHRWNNGLPPAAIVSEMNYIDSISSRGKFYVVIGTYGRGIWMREISGDDPISVGSQNLNVPPAYELKQNYPNPFNPSTAIEYALPVTDHVELNVFDISGREVSGLVNTKMPAGNHKVYFDGAGLSSGVYFYRLKTSKLVETKKMILIK